MKKTKLLLALCLTSCMAFAQKITTIAGNGTAGSTGDGGAATSAELHTPLGVSIDGSGNVYIGDYSNNKIRKVNTSGTISTFAGTGTAGYSGDGAAATSAKLNGPAGISVDGSGNIFFADANNHVIRKINTSGNISTVAGNGTGGNSGDGGAATSATLNDPLDVAVDASGNLFICDYSSHVIRKVNTSGIISTIAGTGISGYSGDGGAAISAKISFPAGVAVDASGNVYIADNGNYRIRKVNTSGTISTFAGTGTAGFSGDGGAATSANIYSPTGVRVDGSGNIYFSSYDDGRIRMVNTSNNISTKAGNGTLGFTGDGGVATSAELNHPIGVAIDGSNNIYIADRDNNRIRKVDPNCITDAGGDKTNTTNCCPPGPCTGVTIGTAAISGYSYSWSPTTNLSSSTVAQPSATPCNTTTPTYYTVTVSGSACTTNQDIVKVTTNQYTGISCCRMGHFSKKEITSFSVYPNPAKNQFTVTLYGIPEYIRIMDISGKLIFEAKDIKESEYLVDVSKYTKGIYFVIAKIGDNLEKQKLLIE